MKSSLGGPAQLIQFLLMISIKLSGFGWGSNSYMIVGPCIEDVVHVIGLALTISPINTIKIYPMIEV